MFYALSWFVVIGLIALWSIAAWGFHAIAAWTFAHAGGLAGGSGSGEAWQLPAWLATWVPPELAEAFTAMLSALAPVAETVVAWMPALAGGLSVAVWVVWAVGTALLVALGIAVSAAIAVLQRRASGPTKQALLPEAAG